MTADLPKRIGIAVVEHAGRYLIGTRGPSGVLAGYAEFPGGKCLPDELPEFCAIRECHEETRLAITVERLLLRRNFKYSHGIVDLHFYLCHPADPASVASDHNGFGWIPASELSSLKFPAANAPVVAMLVDAAARE